MGRPRKFGQRRIFRLTLRLWEGEDDDLIAFFEALPPGQRVNALKVALRNGHTLNSATETNDLPTEDDLDDLMGALMM